MYTKIARFLWIFWKNKLKNSFSWLFSSSLFPIKGIEKKINKHKYSRKEAAFPHPYLQNNKYWSPVARIDNVYGDRNLFCSCPPLDEYEELENTA